VLTSLLGCFGHRVHHATGAATHVVEVAVIQFANEDVVVLDFRRHLGISLLLFTENGGASVCTHGDTIVGHILLGCVSHGVDQSTGAAAHVVELGVAQRATLGFLHFARHHASSCLVRPGCDHRTRLTGNKDHRIATAFAPFRGDQDAANSLAR
jgi:hypothetical protein